MTDAFRNHLEVELKKYNSRLERIEKEIRLAHPEIQSTWEQLRDMYNSKKSEAEFRLQEESQLFI